ncbi:hypothetical protein BOS5A_211237 [Bosea sp. EC-HK365B]|nr:hypothetical protein BOSE21B_50455 [Bosea sp. 21B]CAD5301033.1 hypothetical protein BOSE7B_90237 [Bosea sp. 7B]VVT60446.1 hypothetical protein BOS5A_211237 [Bosea sp. EC-HK365B]VXB61780.1 hypothetical protein BOSE127_140180 [Bosea sp. 127]
MAPSTPMPIRQVLNVIKACHISHVYNMTDEAL